MTTYEFDTSLDPNFPVLTRGNAGEIMPGDYDHLLSKIADDENRFLALN